MAEVAEKAAVVGSEGEDARGRNGDRGRGRGRGSKVTGSLPVCSESRGLLRSAGLTLSFLGTS